MVRLILHSIKMHRVQTVSLVLSVALSTMIIVLFGLVYGGVIQGVDAARQRGGADIVAIPKDSLQYLTESELLYTGAPAPIYMDEAVMDQIATAKGIAHISPQFFSQTLNSACCSATGETRLIGIDTETDFIVRPLAGNTAVSSLTNDSIIIGSEVGGVFDGTLTIRDKKYRVLRVMEETGTEFDSSIVCNIDVARAISASIEDYSHYWDTYGDPDTLISCITIDVAEGDDGTALTAIRARINLSGVAVPIERSQVVDKSLAQLQSVFILLLVAACLMGIVTLLQLFARFFSRVWDRKSELALYRAIGASRAHLKKMIVGEIGIVVGIGLVVGLILGFAAQEALIGILKDGMAFPYVALALRQAVGLALIVIAIFAVVSIVSVIWPLRQIGRLDPSAAMQQGDID